MGRNKTASTYGRSMRGVDQEALEKENKAQAQGQLSGPDQRPWDPLRGEPDLWYDRFHTYMLLGMGRSVNACYQVTKSSDPEITGNHPGQAWYDCRDKYYWDDRARAWDMENWRRLQEEEDELRQQARSSRLEMIKDLKFKTFLALNVAKVDWFTKEEARENLSQLRMMFFQLLSAEREELEGKLEDEGGEGLFQEITEDIARALRKVYGGEEGAVVDVVPEEKQIEGE